MIVAAIVVNTFRLTVTNEKLCSPRDAIFLITLCCNDELFLYCSNNFKYIHKFNPVNEDKEGKNTVFRIKTF